MPDRNASASMLIMMVAASLTLGACSGHKSDSSNPASDNPSASAETGNPTVTTAQHIPNPEQTIAICKEGIAELFGRSADTMKSAKLPGGIVRISYRREDDGTIWTNDCRLDGERIMWRAVDVSPGSGPGRWRDGPDDEKLTYTLVDNKITIQMTF